MILSASRRTDIPAFYMGWFLRRLEAGFCRTVNPFNPRQQRNVSLLPDAVDAIVFWTRDPGSLVRAAERLEALGHTRSMALVTILAYGRELEPHVPRAERAVDGMRRLAERWGGPDRLCWRYDPILIGPRDSPDDHRRRFERLARELEGSTGRAIVSMLDLYRKTLRKLRQLGPDGYAHAGAGVETSASTRALIRDLAAMAAARGMEMRVCAEPVSYEEEGASPGRCIDPELLERLFPERSFQRGKDRGQRRDCGCALSVDVGMPDTCLYGCVYCYATRSHGAALKSFRRHDPGAETLVPGPAPH